MGYILLSSLGKILLSEGTNTEIEEVDYLQALGRGCDNEVPFLYVPCTLQYIV